MTLRTGAAPTVRPLASPAAPSAPGKAAGVPERHRPGQSPLPVLIPVALLLGASVYWASYYLAAPSERVRNPLHPWLRPSGYLGQSAGILALLIFIFLWLYPLRKSVSWLRWTGAMSKWLDVHVTVALVLPALAAFHASWRFDGLIGLGFWSMMVVCLSGIVGRYLYVHIPRSASGLELNAEEIAEERRELLLELARAAKLPAPQVESLLRSDPTPCEGLGIVATLRQMVKDHEIRWRSARALRRVCARVPNSRLDRRSLKRVMKLASREMALTQQARMLTATRRVFRLWHIAHRPFAIAALVAVLVHVGVVVSLGMTWFW
jgi:hypothetical protein